MDLPYNWTKQRMCRTNVIKDSIRSELLLSNELRTTTKGEDVFELVHNFFKKNGLQWSKLVECTTDGAPAMLGGNSRF